MAPTSEPASEPRNQVNPESAMRGPTRLWGRRDQLISPQAISVHPTVRSTAPAATLSPNGASHSAPSPSTTPAGHAVLRRPRPKGVRPLRDESRDCTTCELILGDE